jgi:hypothetical protein
VSGPPAPPGAIACPRCGAHVAEDGDWCLHCGAAARRRLAPTPNWRLPLALAAVMAALSGIAIALAFVELTRDEPAGTPATTAPPPAPASAPPASAAPSSATTPTTTTPTTTTATTPPTTAAAPRTTQR